MRRARGEQGHHGAERRQTGRRPDAGLRQAGLRRWWLPGDDGDVRYDDDLVLWGAEQVAALWAGRLDGLDLHHLAEEINGFAGSTPKV
jgi:hypothetical protein